MVKITQNSWLGGQLDWEMTGRQDVNKYKTGATVLKNFVPVRRGSIVKRPGTDFVCDISQYVTEDNGVGAFRMVPFGYLKDSGFVIVFKNEAARAFSSSPGVAGFTKSGSGSYSDIVNELPEGVKLYRPDELDEICYCQCGDVLFLAHSNHPPMEIRHTYSQELGHLFVLRECPVNTNPRPPTVTSCSIRRCYVSKSYRGGLHYERYAASVIILDSDTGEEVESELSKVYESSGASVGSQADNEKKIESDKMDYSAWTGTAYFLPWTESQEHTVTVRATEKNVKEVRLYKDSGGTWGLIASKRNEEGTWDCSATPKTFTFADNNIQPDTSVSPVDPEKVFCSDGNYPSTVAVYQQRLIWGSTKNNPARVWLSKSGDFYQYQAHKSLQLDDPIDFILPITRFAKINFIVELRKLIMFSDACEWLVGSNSDTSGITFETIMATAHSYIGCSRRLPPIVCNNSVMFAERTGQAVREYGYQIEGDIYGGRDVSVFSSSIFDEKRIVDWTYQQHPNSTIWCVLSDGTFASLVFMKDQEVCAWATHEMGGSGKVKGIATTYALFGNDGSNASTEEVMVAVQRGRVVTLERMRPWCEDTDTPANACTMDCCVRDGSGVEAYSGMTLAEAAKTSGYPFLSRMTTVHPVLGSQVGNAQFDIKNAQYAHLRMQKSVGGSVRAIEMPECQASRMTKTVLPAVESGKMSFEKVDEDILLEGSNNRDGRVVVEQCDPWPFQLLLLETDFEVEEGGQ